MKEQIIAYILTSHKKRKRKRKTKKKHVFLYLIFVNSFKHPLCYISFLLIDLSIWSCPR